MLFDREHVVGIFRGFSGSGLEFHADLVLPYRSEFQSAPMHGQFLLVQLEDENEGVLGRITSIASEGRLASGTGEDYGLRAMAEEREIPEDLREQYLRYRVNIRVLGVVRAARRKVVFAPSLRRLPHVGSKVAFLSEEVLKEITGHNGEGAELGHFALGEFIYAGRDGRLQPLEWMRVCEPAIVPRFDIRQIVSRRSFVFARAGFGKSNLNKLLFSNLYAETPTVEKRGGRQTPVGTVIFDPDGEYFWPDDKNRPGLCDVPHLEDKVVVFTNRKAPSPFYQSFVASGIKLDIRRLPPTSVISIALSLEKQEQQNVRKLKGLNDTDWHQLVDEIYANGNAADGKLIKKLLRLDTNQDVEMVAARANMTTITKMLHDPSSQMLDMLLECLRQGKLCVVDVSQMRGAPARILAGLILQRIFDHNQDQFTSADPATIPTIAVIEEAQAVLGSSGSAGEGPYISWVKEGRKYDLGAVMITQQPGSISPEILSQGDNWFVFHLLSSGDLRALQGANAHFSPDLLSSLLNEPIPGHAIFWSSTGGKSYPISVRVLLFEALHATRDPTGSLPSAQTFARQIRARFDGALVGASALMAQSEDFSFARAALGIKDGAGEGADVLKTYIASAVVGLLQNEKEQLNEIRLRGVPWIVVQRAIEKYLPDVISNRGDFAYQNMRAVLDQIFGEGKWDTEPRPRRGEPGRSTTWIVLKRA
jgi:DNA helicase HerA-like ATPase